MPQRRSEPDKQRTYEIATGGQTWTARGRNINEAIVMPLPEPPKEKRDAE